MRRSQYLAPRSARSERPAQGRLTSLDEDEDDVSCRKIKIGVPYKDATKFNV